jgi:hypothetical protein
MNNITIVEDVGLLYKYDYHTSNRKTQYVFEPKPTYSRKKGQLIVLAKSTFGKRRWELPTFEVCRRLTFYCFFILLLPPLDDGLQ